MNRVRFYLKDKNASKETLIYMRLILNGKTIKYSASKNIHPDLWDNSTCRPTKVKSLISRFKKKSPMIEVHLNNLSHRLNTIEDNVLSFINVNEQNSIETTSQSLKSHLNNILGRDGCVYRSL